MCHKCLIENFWSILKRKVYFDGWKAETNEVLIERTKKMLKNPSKCLPETHERIEDKSTQSGR
jgi:hypothetical protein